MKKIMAAIMAAILLISAAGYANPHKSKMRMHIAKQAVIAKTKVDINSADVKALETLKGIGSKKAQAIVAYREQHGRFSNWHDVTKVRGVGDKWVAKLKANNPGRLLLGHSK